MRSATKVLLETLQVTRHVGRLGIRPMEKATGEALHACEETATWMLKLQPVEDLLTPQRTKLILDSYHQAKEVVTESVANLSHQSLMSSLQSGAKAATFGLQQAGLEIRVVGPFDEHWNTGKVLTRLQVAAREHAAPGGHADTALQLTPKRFVGFMRDAEAKKRRTSQRDPIEDYVEWMLENGVVTSMGPRPLEKKVYTDIMRIICFAFDRAVMEANGRSIWGHELRVKVASEDADTHATHLATRHVQSNVGLEQVEAVVDQMIQSQDLRAPLGMKALQRQLLVNCCAIILKVLEDLTSDRNMQVNLLGHNVRIALEPLPLEPLLRDAAMQTNAITEQVNTRAVDELVDALLDEPEVQLVFMPDLLEAEIYRYVVHRMICIAQFILSQLRVSLFGIEVRLGLLPEAEEGRPAEDMPPSDEPKETLVPTAELQRLLARVEHERRCVERELQARRHLQRSLEEPEELSSFRGTDDDSEQVSDFARLASEDRLSRSLAVQRIVSVPIDVAFSMVSDVQGYNQWMPFCTSAQVLQDLGKNVITCEVGFGLETAIGNVGDQVKYRMMNSPPKEKATGDGLRIARVVADTPDGFAYGKRLVYDWKFTEVAPGETDVRLDMFFQASNFFFLPIWDSMQTVITDVMMTKFMQRAKFLTGGTSAAVDGGADGSTEAAGNERSEGETIYYLPKMVRGLPVMIPQADGMWLADNSSLQSASPTVGYRKSMDLADRAGEGIALKFGDTVRGEAIGDWVKCSVKEPAASSRQVQNVP